MHLMCTSIGSFICGQFDSIFGCPRVTVMLAKLFLKTVKIFRPIAMLYCVIWSFALYFAKKVHGSLEIKPYIKAVHHYPR